MKASSIPTPEMLAAVDDRTLAANFLDLCLRLKAVDAALQQRFDAEGHNQIVEEVLSEGVDQLAGARDVFDRADFLAAKIRLRMMFRLPVTVHATHTNQQDDNGQNYRVWTVDLLMAGRHLRVYGLHDEEQYSTGEDGPADPAMIQVAHMLDGIDGALAEAAMNTADRTAEQEVALQDLFKVLDRVRDLAIQVGDSHECDVEIKVLPLKFLPESRRPILAAP